MDWSWARKGAEVDSGVSGVRVSGRGVGVEAGAGLATGAESGCPGVEGSGREVFGAFPPGLGLRGVLKGDLKGWVSLAADASRRRRLGAGVDILRVGLLRWLRVSVL